VFDSSSWLDLAELKRQVPFHSDLSELGIAIGS
jgi:hypothetical protein